uniref:Piwi domain-containing protein n=1 Tax=Parastrongyloides trichosuri TaxID=131310 RepID=A0A0N4Z3G3_PARTI
MSSEKIATQLHKLSFEEGTVWYRYKCKVEVVYPNSDKVRDLTFTNEDETSIKSSLPQMEKKGACKFAVKKACEKSNNFGVGSLAYAYDGISNFVSNSKIVGKQSVVLDRDDLGSTFKAVFRRGSVKVSLDEEVTCSQIALSKVELNADNEEYQLIKNCLELITLQQATNDPSIGGGGYVQLNSGKTLTERKSEYQRESTGPGRVIIGGFTKSIKLLNIDGPTLALSIDVTKNVYYKAEPLDKIIKDEIFGGRVPRDLNTFRNSINDNNIKGVHVQTTHRKHGEIFKFNHDLHTGTARNTFLDIKNGARRSVEEYFAEKYHFKLRYPEWPLFVHKFKRVTMENGEKKTEIILNYYPLEVLSIIPGQQVPVNKMDSISAVSQQKINTRGPYDRKSGATDQFNKLGASLEGNLFSKFGIIISPSTSFVTSSVAQPVSVQVGQCHFSRGDYGKIKNDNKPGFYGTTSRYDLLIVSNNHCEDRTIETFLQRYINRCKDNRIVFETTNNFHKCNTGMEEERLITELKNACKKIRNPFVLMIDSKRIKHSHISLKVFEQETGILTQHVTFEVVAKCPNQIMTLDNVIRKTNAKMGGLNFHVELNEKYLKSFNIHSNEVLYIGLDLALSVCGTIIQDSATSVGGWCANLGKRYGQFCGDYWYQNKNCADSFLIEEEQLKGIFNRILSKWNENNPGNVPKKIIFFRCGLNELQFKKALDIEVDILINMKKKMSEIFGRDVSHCKYTYVFVSKKDNTRFYSLKENDVVENLKPGTFISNEFSLYNEIRMYSKVNASCLGTAQLPLYYLAYDENEGQERITKEILQSIVNMLCFTYDIIPAAVSIPAPAYIAGQFVKRGNNNNQGFAKINKAQFQVEDYVTYSREKNYSGSALEFVRFNA